MPNLPASKPASKPPVATATCCKIAADMLALCDAATISEVPGLGIPKSRKPRRMS